MAGDAAIVAGLLAGFTQLPLALSVVGADSLRIAGVCLVSRAVFSQLRMRVRLLRDLFLIALSAILGSYFTFAEFNGTARAMVSCAILSWVFLDVFRLLRAEGKGGLARPLARLFAFLALFFAIRWVVLLSDIQALRLLVRATDSRAALTVTIVGVLGWSAGLWLMEQKGPREPPALSGGRV